MLTKYEIQCDMLMIVGYPTETEKDFNDRINNRDQGFIAFELDDKFGAYGLISAVTYTLKNQNLFIDRLAAYKEFGLSEDCTTCYIVALNCGFNNCAL